MDLCLGSLFCSIMYVCFYAKPYSVIYYSFVTHFAISEHCVSSFVLLYQDCFGYLSFLCFHTHIIIFFSYFGENVIGFLIGIAVNL